MNIYIPMFADIAKPRRAGG